MHSAPALKFQPWAGPSLQAGQLELLLSGKALPPIQNAAPALPPLSSPPLLLLPQLSGVFGSASFSLPSPAQLPQVTPSSLFPSPLATSSLPAMLAFICGCAISQHHLLPIPAPPLSLSVPQVPWAWLRIKLCLPSVCLWKVRALICSLIL